MKYSIIGLILIVFLCPLHAQDNPCSTAKLAKKNIFDKSYKVGLTISQKICEVHHPDMPDGFNNSTVMSHDDIKALGEQWRSELLTASKELQTIDTQLKNQVDFLFAGYFDNQRLEKFQVNPNGRKVLLTVTNADITSVNRNDCNGTSFGVNCKILFDDLAVVANVPYEMFDQNQEVRVAANAGMRSANWNRFFSEARSQTFIELYINTWLYADEFTKGKPVDPPAYQVSFLHPSIVLQQVADANDGDQLKEAIAIEWAGINFWDETIPIGISVVSTYTDRAGISDVGNGIMIHIKNKYSIGVTHHNNEVGDSYGVFLTIDLLGLFESTNSNYKSYLKTLNSILKV
jgi:hypothetical protein